MYANATGFTKGRLERRRTAGRAWQGMAGRATSRGGVLQPASGQRPASRGRRPAQPALRVGAMGLLGISGPDGERLIRLRCTVLCGNA